MLHLGMYCKCSALLYCSYSYILLSNYYTVTIHYKFVAVYVSNRNVRKSAAKSRGNVRKFHSARRVFTLTLAATVAPFIIGIQYSPCKQMTHRQTRVANLQAHILIYEGRSKSFEPNPFKRKVDKWAYLYFSAYSPPLSVHSLYWSRSFH